MERQITTHNQKGLNQAPGALAAGSVALTVSSQIPWSELRNLLSGI